MKRARVFIIIGAVLILLALALSAYNIVEDSRAGEASDAALAKFDELIRSDAPNEEDPPDTDDDTDTDTDADTDTDERDEGDDVPEVVVSPDIEMPEARIDGNEYIGVLYLPTIDRRLPIISKCDNKKLKSSPCRYCGSVYSGDLVIAGHNYQKHLSNLKNLHIGDPATFTDCDGNVFSYRVIEIETISPDALDYLKTGDWDMTVFTCTFGGRTRAVARFELVK